MSQEAAPLDRRTEERALLLIYGSCAGYMVALGMMQVLVPLYALYLGRDLAEVGIIVASQAVFGLALRLFGGAISDQFGERWVLLFAFATISVGSLVFALSGAFWVLIAGQLFMGISRANYWTSTQSYASRVNPRRAGEALGRIAGIGNAGQVIGTFLAGVLAVTIGYGWSFAASAAIAAAGLLGALLLPPIPRKSVRRGFVQALRPIPGLFKSKGMAMAAFAAFMASSSMSYAQVLFIPYFQDIGYNDAANSALRTLSIAGSVATGVVFGQLLARIGERRLYAVSFALMGLALLTVPAVAGAAYLLVPLMAAHGAVHGVLGAIYTATAASQSAPEQRGMAMGYVGLYWGVGQLAVPAAFGFIARSLGLPAAIWLAAALFLLAAALSPGLYARLIPRTVAADAVPVDGRHR